MPLIQTGGERPCVEGQQVHCSVVVVDISEALCRGGRERVVLALASRGNVPVECAWHSWCAVQVIQLMVVYEYRDKKPLTTVRQFIWRMLLSIISPLPSHRRSKCYWTEPYLTRNSYKRLQTDYICIGRVP